MEQRTVNGIGFAGMALTPAGLMGSLPQYSGNWWLLGLSALLLMVLGIKDIFKIEKKK